MKDLKIACPHCQQHLEVPNDMLGQVTECPACHQSIQLPSAPKESAGQPLPASVLNSAPPAAAPQAPAGIYVKKTTVYALSAVALVALIGVGGLLVRRHSAGDQAPGPTVSGTVTVSSNDGTHLHPRTSLLLAPSGSSAAEEVFALLKKVQACSESSDKLDLLQRQWQARDPYDGAAAAKTAADKKKCDEAVHKLWMEVLARESEIIPKAASLPRAKTNTEGEFAFADIKPGKYVLYARTQAGDQQIFWVREVFKKRAMLTVSFDHDKALIIRR